MLNFKRPLIAVSLLLAMTSCASTSPAPVPPCECPQLDGSWTQEVQLPALEGRSLEDFIRHALLAEIALKRANAQFAAIRSYMEKIRAGH